MYPFKTSGFRNPSDPTPPDGRPVRCGVCNRASGYNLGTSGQTLGTPSTSVARRWCLYNVTAVNISLSFTFLHNTFPYRMHTAFNQAVNVSIFLPFFLMFVVPSIMLYSSEISPTRCNNCVFILRNGFTLHVSDDNLTHHQEYICCIWPQVSRLT